LEDRAPRGGNLIARPRILRAVPLTEPSGHALERPLQRHRVHAEQHSAAAGVTCPNGKRHPPERYRAFFDFNEIIDYNEIMQTGDTPMSSITIRNLDPSIKERLRVRAAERGHSMEAEARRILQTALSASGRAPGRNLYERIHARFAPLGGVNLELPPREPVRDPPRFD
jgi:plasmid stability protein